jgi:hypothetical protein
LNLYYTDWVSESEIDNELQHDCLRVVSFERLSEVMFYCMSELPSKFHIKNDNSLSKFTFVELSKKNISSEQLYLWSAPIDLIERYQFYLNQFLTENKISLVKEMFYNCPIPRFGPKCEYEFDYNYRDYSSSYEMLVNFYINDRYDPTILTCYTHLKCNCGPYPLCLDWSEICNGQINLLISMKKSH